MDDSLTKSVLDYQIGNLSLSRVRNLILEAAFAHLLRYRRKGEDDISDFLLLFHERIEALLGRFHYQGLPFRHFLFRSLRWQWNTFQAERAQRRRQESLAADAWRWEATDDCLAEAVQSCTDGELALLSAATRRRLVLLALKAAPYLEDIHLEAVSQHAGVDLAWLQACQYRLTNKTRERRERREQIVRKRGDAFSRRLLAEDEARRESDPERRQVHEGRAGLYRRRLASLNRQQESLSTAPTHLELANLLGMPKGSVDSGLYHLKRNLGTVYSGGNDDPPGNKQPPQKTRTRGNLS